MPLVLPKGAEGMWTDSSQTDAKAALVEALALAVTALEHYPVSKRVNSTKNEGLELIEPINRA